ncbi:hypothetical protein CYMTET_9648 [Cymbomonas tetramitiformis]|uniref:Uncharacterized protein n=1 Tax=Cymbomonas tetramitiformis TaxID=36881 RepID=A0AAE0GR98_9CHLO|nr:hypothetical protein CYMTET_9648 [Cymbomonas tetramitiformis]
MPSTHPRRGTHRNPTSYPAAATTFAPTAAPTSAPVAGPNAAPTAAPSHARLWLLRVACALTYSDLSIDAFDSAFSSTFAAEFKQQMAASAGVTAADVVVRDYVAGSITVHSDTGFNTTTSYQLFVSTLIEDPGSIFTYPSWAAYGTVTSTNVTIAWYNMPSTMPPTSSFPTFDNATTRPPPPPSLVTLSASPTSAPHLRGGEDVELVPGEDAGASSKSRNAGVSESLILACIGASFLVAMGAALVMVRNRRQGRTGMPDYLRDLGYKADVDKKLPVLDDIGEKWWVDSDVGTDTETSAGHMLRNAVACPDASNWGQPLGVTAQWAEASSNVYEDPAAREIRWALGSTLAEASAADLPAAERTAPAPGQQLEEVLSMATDVISDLPVLMLDLNTLQGAGIGQADMAALSDATLHHVEAIKAITLSTGPDPSPDVEGDEEHTLEDLINNVRANLADISDSVELRMRERRVSDPLDDNRMLLNRIHDVRERLRPVSVDKQAPSSTKGTPPERISLPVARPAAKSRWELLAAATTDPPLQNEGPGATSEKAPTAVRTAAKSRWELLAGARDLPLMNEGQDSKRMVRNPLMKGKALLQQEQQEESEAPVLSPPGEGLRHGIARFWTTFNPMRTAATMDATNLHDREKNLL